MYYENPGYDEIMVIGDEIHFKGELVAIIATTATPTVAQQFADLMEYGHDGKDDEDEQGSSEVKLPEGLPQFVENLRKLVFANARGGLLYLRDFDKLVARAKERQ